MPLKIGWNDGHTLSGKGTGAVGIISETDRNRRIGSKVRSMLTNEYEGITVINCTIDKSENDLAAAVKIANDNKCDVFISNHVNAGGGKGFEGFYSRFKTKDIDKGRIIYDSLVRTKSCLLARRYCDDFSYKGFDLYVIRYTTMPAFLFEIGFVDNAECVKAVNDDEVAKAYVEGIAKAYGLKKKTKEEIKVEGIILYKGEADGFLANWLGQAKGWPVMKVPCTIDLSEYKEVVCIGYTVNDYPRCTRLISGANRKATLLALYNYV